ncbi:MAG: hypothetical protein A2Y94_14900 [Caldithrix sp. RBG_13_44_9]|nr:MAG: hypothetical protein A2Y94_14900 [Caldithrix sp. RBG_13_44_9]
MKYLTTIIILLFICLVLTEYSCSPSEKDNLILQLLRNRPDLFQQVLENPKEFRLQILYTQINRDQNNFPQFVSYSYRVNERNYFYPASTVKLPAALLALEKLNNLAIPGLDKFTPLKIDSAFSGQTRVQVDTTAADSLPIIAHYIKKIFLVSDNDAYNRLYEFLGQQYITETLRQKGYQHTHLVRRLERALSPEENRSTNPFTFYQSDQIIYQQPLIINPNSYRLDMRDIRQGKGYYKNDELINQPMDFSNSNYFSVPDQQAILKSVFFPDAVPEICRFNLTEDDYRFVFTYMGLRPRESEITAYHDTTEYYDGYVKFFMFGDTREPIPSSIRIFDKCGESYGYLIDNAYIVDFEKEIEFLLTAVIQVNQDQIYNDDKYEYDEIGFPFLANLGRVIYEYEVKREREFSPDLTRFQLFN